MIKSIKTGVSQLRNARRLLIVYYFFNLIFGLILMLPMRAAVSKFAGHSLMGSALAGSFNMDFLFEFLKNNSNLFSIYGSLLLIMLILNGMLTLFLSGGSIALFLHNRGFDQALFWSSCAKYFTRFIRLFLMALPIFAIIMCLQFLETGIQRLLFGADPYQYINFWGAWIKFGLRTISFILIMIIFDYARIHAVKHDETKMRISLWQGLKFITAHFKKALLLALALYLLGAVLLFIYNPIANALSAPNIGVLLLLIIVQQLYMLFRMALRLLLFSSQVELFESAESKQTILLAEDETGLEGATA